MLGFLLFPFLLQSAAMAVDELYFHRRRGLPRWERIGHPLDTVSILLCFLMVLAVPFTWEHLRAYLALSLFSCLLITKDEAVHKRHCSAGEQWVHAVLFVAHPLVLTVGGIAWPLLHGALLPGLEGAAPYLTAAFVAQCAVMLGFLAYQTLFWNFFWEPPQHLR